MVETLFTLAEQIRRCTACTLWKGRTLAVPGEGPKNAKVMVIGEAPGEKEDREGVPFVGKAGKFLDEMFVNAGMRRQDVFITSSVKCRPPKNRSPTLKECGACKNLWLEKQIAILNPRLVILLGGVAVRTCLNKKNLRSLHGKTFTQNGRTYFVLYHPSAAMRFPLIQEMMAKDLVKLKKALQEIN